MKIIRITIQVEPTAKGRARVAFIAGKVRTYTPTKTVNAQAFIRERLARHIKDTFPPHIPIRLSATFYRSKSRYLPKKETMPFRKPDLDNFAKTLLDSIGDLIPDDAQITTMNVRKRWSKKPEGYIMLKLEGDKENGKDL